MGYIPTTPPPPPPRREGAGRIPCPKGDFYSFFIPCEYCGTINKSIANCPNCGASFKKPKTDEQKQK